MIPLTHCTVHVYVLIQFCDSNCDLFWVEVTLWRFTIVCFHWIKRGRVGIQWTVWTQSHFCAWPTPGPGFQMSVIYCGLFYVQWFVVRGDCSFCLYWSNCWPSLFKLFIIYMTAHFSGTIIIFLLLFSLWLQQDIQG